MRTLISDVPGIVFVNYIWLKKTNMSLKHNPFKKNVFSPNVFFLASRFGNAILFIFVYILSTQKDWIVSFYWYWIYNCPCFCLLELACFLYFVLAVGISFSSLNGICRRLTFWLSDYCKEVIPFSYVIQQFPTPLFPHKEMLQLSFLNFVQRDKKGIRFVIVYC